jgi:hypothetical protein
MVTSLLERYFSGPKQPESILMLGLVSVIVLGLWLGRRRLNVAVPVSIVALVAGLIGVPSCFPAAATARRAACVNNLKLIETAKVAWLATNSGSPTAPTMQDLFGSGSSGWPVCPSAGRYSAGKTNERPKCDFASRQHKL